MVTAGFLAASCCLWCHRRLPGESATVRGGPGGLPGSARRLRGGECRIAAPLEASTATVCARRARAMLRPVVTAPVTAFGGRRARSCAAHRCRSGGADRDARVRSVTGASVTADALAEQLSADRPPVPPRRSFLPERSGSPSGRRARRRHHAGAVAHHHRRAAGAGALRRFGSGADRRAARWRGPHSARSGDRESEFRVSRREHSARVGRTVRSLPAVAASASPGSTGTRPAGTGRVGSGQAEVQTQPDTADICTGSAMPGS